MAVGDAYVFPGFLTPVLTLLFFPKPPTTFLIYFCRGERRKYTGRKVASTGDRTHNNQVMKEGRTEKEREGRNKGRKEGRKLGRKKGAKEKINERKNNNMKERKIERMKEKRKKKTEV